MPRGPEFTQDLHTESFPSQLDSPLIHPEIDYFERNKNKKPHKTDAHVHHSSGTRTSPTHTAQNKELLDKLHGIYGSRPTDNTSQNVYEMWDQRPARFRSEDEFRRKFNNADHSMIAGHEYPVTNYGEDD